MSIGQIFERGEENVGTRMPLRRWLWRSYLRSAIIPLLFIELSFLAIYWISYSSVYRENVQAISLLSREFLQDIAKREATSIGNGLAGISRSADLLARQSLHALKGTYDPPASEKARYATSPQGGFHTRYDNGTTASFYSNITPIGPEQRAKVWRLSALDPLMMDIEKSNPEVESVYFNTFDSYNRIYPYFDVTAQYPPDMNIPTYNFYYEADAAHNPARRPVWTDAYVDPAGHGWMISSIAPVWNGDKLEGVVGIDVTLSTIIQRLMKLSLRWEGYAILVDRQGRIIAMPPAGEQDFGLKELTRHHYSEAIQTDTFKPDAFNINRRADTRALAQAMRKAPDGVATVNFDGPHTASFSTIAGPGWRLVVIAPNSRIFADAEALRTRLRAIGLFMLAGLLVFYVAFFAMLFRRARLMSKRVAQPVGAIASVIERIGEGRYRQEFAGSRVQELDELGRRIVQTGAQLGEAHERISEQERVVSNALARQKQANEELVRFMRIMSHELRTPLAVIDSGAQMINRKAESLQPDDLRMRSGKLRDAVRRISDLLHKMVSSLQLHDDPQDAEAGQASDLVGLARAIASDLVTDERVRFDAPGSPLEIYEAASWRIVIRTVLDNAVRYSPAASPIGLAISASDGRAQLTISDAGPGIPASELPHVGERFFRGAATAGTEGTGVGLYVARKLAEELGGAIAVASNGGGTQVTITIPLRNGTDRT